MSCDAIEKKLPLLAGDELSPAGRRRVERHLRECSRCRREADGYRALRRNVAEALSPGDVGQAVERAREKAIRRIFLENRPIRSISFIRRPAFSAVAAALLTVVLVGLLTSTGNLWNRRTGGGVPGPDIQEVQVITVPTQDGVMLTWDNGDNTQYMVLRSNSPKNFDNSNAIQVCGDRYVEKRGDGESLTYYKVFRTKKGCS